MQRQRPRLADRPPNRFGGPWYELDFEHVEQDDEYLESLRHRPTEYIPDNSKSIVTENDSVPKNDVSFQIADGVRRGAAKQPGEPDAIAGLIWRG